MNDLLTISRSPEHFEKIEVFPGQVAKTTSENVVDMAYKSIEKFYKKTKMYEALNSPAQLMDTIIRLKSQMEIALASY